MEIAREKKQEIIVLKIQIVIKNYHANKILLGLMRLNVEHGKLQIIYVRMILNAPQNIFVGMLTVEM